MEDQSRQALVALRQARDDYETSLRFSDGSTSQLQYLNKARRAVDHCETLIKNLTPSQKEDSQGAP